LLKFLSARFSLAQQCFGYSAPWKNLATFAIKAITIHSPQRWWTWEWHTFLPLVYMGQQCRIWRISPKKVDQTVSLAELDGSDIVYTGRVEVPKIVSVGVTVGARLTSASTAVGQVLLAAVPDAELHDVLSIPSLSMFLPRTRFTAEQIRPRLQTVREQGWAESDEDLQYGVQAIAAPLHGEDGQVIAAVGFGAHTSEVGKEVLREQYLPLLLETARNIDSDWEHCRRLPISESSLNMDGMQLLHLRRISS
jgi:IclR family pca regulon transcriptional regulator